MKDSQYFGFQLSLMVLAGLVATAPLAKIGFIAAAACYGIAAAYYGRKEDRAAKAEQPEVHP